MQYHEKPLLVVIGGIIRGVQDILDKILLMHSMMDLNPLPQFYLMGELGLAGLYALGVKVGRVDRPGDNLADYA